MCMLEVISSKKADIASTFWVVLEFSDAMASSNILKLGQEKQEKGQWCAVSLGRYLWMQELSSELSRTRESWWPLWPIFFFSSSWSLGVIVIAPPNWHRNSRRGSSSEANLLRAEEINVDLSMLFWALENYLLITLFLFPCFPCFFVSLFVCLLAWLILFEFLYV